MRRTAVLAFVAACATRPAQAPLTDEMPHPGPRASAFDARAANDACVRCHEGAAETWRTSLHAATFTNPVFAKSFAREPAAFCENCHAPERPSDLGVACVTCHDPRGTGDVLATTASSKSAPHRLRRTKAFEGDAACASCHDFPFPDVEARGHDGARLQRTVGEHRASPFASVSCASCHVGERRSHAFAVASDPAFLRSALDVKARRDGDRVVIELVPRRVGHAVPTGDLFRRLLVVAGDRVVPLGRRFRFEDVAGVRVQRELADERVQDARTVTIPVPPGPIGWRVEWQRVGGMSEDVAFVEGTVTLAEGRL